MIAVATAIRLQYNATRAPEIVLTHKEELL